MSLGDKTIDSETTMSVISYDKYPLLSNSKHDFLLPKYSKEKYIYYTLTRYREMMYLVSCFYFH